MSRPRDMKVTPEVAAVGLIPISGNVIPHTWYEHVRRNGRVQANALLILADIVFYYRPTEIIDEDQQSIRYERKFYGDLLQRYARYYTDKFGLTINQVREAMRCLRDDVGVIFTIARDFPEEGRYNVPFVGIHPDRLWEITVPEDFQQKCPFTWSRSTLAPARETETPPSSITDPCDTSQTPCDTSQTPCDESQTPCDVSRAYIYNNIYNNIDHNGETVAPATEPATLDPLEALMRTTRRDLTLKSGGYRARVERLAISQAAMSDEDGMPLSTLTAFVNKLAEIHKTTALVEADEKELERMRDMARTLWRMSENYRTVEALEKLAAAFAIRNPGWGEPKGRQFTQFASKMLTESTEGNGGTNDNPIDYTELARQRQDSLFAGLDDPNA